MKNLLNETISVLGEYGKSSKDVEWVGNSNWGWFTWKDFEQLAGKMYDDGYGLPEVAIDLVIAGKDWWLERYEYNGAEKWIFKTLQKPKKYRKPKKIFGSFGTLKELNQEEEV